MHFGPVHACLAKRSTTPDIWVGHTEYRATMKETESIWSRWNITSSPNATFIDSPTRIAIKLEHQAVLQCGNFTYTLIQSTQPSPSLLNSVRRDYTTSDEKQSERASRQVGPAVLMWLLGAPRILFRFTPLPSKLGFSQAWHSVLFESYYYSPDAKIPLLFMNCSEREFIRVDPLHKL